MSQTGEAALKPSVSKVRRKRKPASRHAYFVALSKRVLWVAAALLLLLLAWLSWGESTQGVRIVFSGVQKNASGLPVMLNPHYQGVDTSNRPFSITAKTATQTDTNNVTLEFPNGDITLQKNRWVSVQADLGLLNVTDKLLDLNNNVQMYYEGGYEMRTQWAQVDLKNATAWGNYPVEGQGPMGVLKANGFEVNDRGKRIRFTGAVQLTIYPSSSDKHTKGKKNPQPGMGKK